MEPARKTHHAAVVIVPPEAVWEPIQRIRRDHDPQVHRWMPHVTMLYPFVPEEWFAEAAARLAPVCRAHGPFHVQLDLFRFFAHSARSATLWLAPEPAGPLTALQADLQAAFPHCDDVAQFEGGFAPHLSVGRFPGREAAEAARRRFQFAWMPIEFTVDAVALIARSGEPDDPFHVRSTVPLGPR